MLQDIEKLYDGEYIVIKGLYFNTFVNDVRRIYKTDPIEAKLFFSILQSGMFFKKVSIKFHKYFALDIYNMMDKLNYITGRSVYAEIMELIRAEPYVANYFKPILPLPSSISNRLGQLSTKLFPFQEMFMQSYYNARVKLGLHGYLLAFEQGLGKTFTAIAASYAFDMVPAIITAPRSTLDGWAKSILNMVPGIKPEEVKIIYEYNPNRDSHKWKYMICNYEQLEKAYEYAKYAVSAPKSLIIDECHNFRYMTTKRSQTLLKVKQDLGIQDVIAISGTPIKALAAELIPIIKLIDPSFTDDAETIFRRIYSKSNYDPISGSVLRKRLDLFIERRKQEEAMPLPPKERYAVEVTINDPSPYLIEQVKKDIWQYVNDNIKDFVQQSKPNYDKLIDMVHNNSLYNDIEEGAKKEYLHLVYRRMNEPMTEQARLINDTIKEYEEEVFRPIDAGAYKSLLAQRRLCTSYTQILLGKGIGKYFVKGKIHLISIMVKENVKEIAKIIRSAEKKTIIFSTYIEPLHSVKEALEAIGIGCVLHTGGDDIRVTRDIFQNDNSVQCLLGTTASIGTGTDGLQFIADMMIFLNQPYRSADTEQCEARIHRKGQDASSVKIYFMKLKTKEPNILEQERLINEWSRAMFRLAID